ncbi:hypothetical protein XELAEV_18035766mg [Xenopus laevis]|uniref:Uncharacterized protein n=1 Tax=Xenopus laevis TaxID=8355 RepID=A0A974HCC6_XENLA|nr:hypothetical protein XELAEV_18035766mg [Xenopus laevis]
MHLQDNAAHTESFNKPDFKMFCASPHQLSQHLHRISFAFLISVQLQTQLTQLNLQQKQLGAINCQNSHNCQISLRFLGNWCTVY